MHSETTKFKGYGLSLQVSNDILMIWEGYKQTNTKDDERFGVIIGSRSETLNEYNIEMVTAPFPKDESTRHSFLLKDENHQSAVNRAFEDTVGTSAYLGTWHTHPELIPTPSTIDKKDWKSCTIRNRDRQLFFVIVGTQEVSVFVRKYFGIRKLELVKQQ